MPARRLQEPSVRETEPLGKALAITTVVCDDHPALASGLAKILDADVDEISVVGIANSGEDAERLVRDLLPDMVLMDITMPGIGGIEATRQIRKASPTTKVVILTISDNTADLYGALRAGATGYVLKDREVSEIADAIRSVHRGFFAIPADLAGKFVDDLDSNDKSALSDQEREILSAIASGETNREIAARLHVSERTIKRRIEDIYRKLHLADRLDAAIYAMQEGLRSERGPRGSSRGSEGT